MCVDLVAGITSCGFECSSGVGKVEGLGEICDVVGVVVTIGLIADSQMNINVTLFRV